MDLKTRIATTDWGVLPAPLWVLIASPLLHYAIGGPLGLFHWPRGRTKNPFRLAFWYDGVKS